MLERLHRFIRNVLKRERAGFVKSEFITDAINSASEDLFLELLTKSKKGDYSDLLAPFKQSTSVTPASLVASNWSDNKIVSAETDQDVEVIVAASDLEWTSAKLEDYVGGVENINPNDPKIKDFVEQASFVSGEIDLDGLNLEFPLAVWNGEYQGIIVPPISLYSKNLSDFHDKETDYESNLTLNTEGESISSFPHTLDSDFVAPLSVYIVLSDGSRHRGVVVPPDKFFSTQLEDIVPDFNKGVDYKHLFYDDHSFSITSSDNGVAELPDDYVDHQNTFTHFYDGQTYEGIILPSDEFLDRKNSVIMPPSTDQPIGRIYGNKIEVYPRPTGGDTYNFALHYKKFNSDRYPVCKVEGGNLYLRGSLPVGATIEFTYIKHPTSRRPIASIVGEKAYIRGSSTGTLVYVAFPSTRKPMIRYQKTGSTDMEFEIKPSTFSGTITVYGYKPPQKASATYTVDNYGEITLSGITDLDWEDEAFSHIASRALFYLGHNTGDQQTISLEANKEGVERNANN